MSNQATWRIGGTFPKIFCKVEIQGETEKQEGEGFRNLIQIRTATRGEDMGIKDFPEIGIGTLGMRMLRSIRKKNCRRISTRRLSRMR
jgi:hypothetical protein